MIPISIIFILFAVGLLFYSSLSLLTLYSKKRKQHLLRKLSCHGSANNLVFCSQELLKDKVIGIDGIHRKIMVLEKIKNTFNSSIISLDEVHDCQLITKKTSLNQGNLTKFNRQFTTAIIELQFEFNNHAQSASIVFSDGIVNSKRELAFLKAKAEYWCLMFSKMLNKSLEVRA